MQDTSQEMTEELAESIDTWRHSVPSRMEREDPFLDDGFMARPSTRITFREPERPTRRPSTRLAFMRAAAPLFGRRPSNPNAPQDSIMERPETALGVREDDDDEAAEAKNPKLRGLFGLFGRKRKHRSPSSSPPPQVVFEAPLTLHFLFVGAKASGQTSLLFRARYGHFPDDTSGAPDLNTVERLSYVQWDAIFLCFDIKEKITLHTILQWVGAVIEMLMIAASTAPANKYRQWHGAVQGGFLGQQQNEVLLHLVGLKKDIRAKCLDEDHRIPGPFDSQSFVPFPTCCVAPSDAAWHARRIGAHRYLECSAMTGEGMEVMLEEAGQEATRRAVEVARRMRMAPSKRRLF
ncbi:rho type ras-like gtpase [Trichoderma arundinaceum]|uniref:Rho type ras-like gtpase n=1 Tax=Trichoderma arundinaceum TaxID=490622 RepID=A0A395NWD2_TRIAR|nr:rho type ras-like gtpase [Trichoderma arundinaceum]